MARVTSVSRVKKPSPRSRGAARLRDHGVVEHLGAHDPVEPEQPGRLGEVAPGVEVGVPLGVDDPARVDHPLGLLVARGHVVAEPDLPLLVGGALQPGRQERLVGVRGVGAGVDPGCLGPLGGSGLELGQRPVHHLAGVVAGTRAQGPERDDQGGGLRGGQPERLGEVVRVGDPDDPVGPDAVAVLGLQGRDVDVDEVVRHATGRPAHPQDLEVLEQLLRGDAEGDRRLVQADLAPRLEVGHQRQQPGDLVLRARGRGRRHDPAPVRAAVSRSTTRCRTSAGPSTTTSGPKARISSA